MSMREHVGARIHLYRKRQNLTLEQLAHLIHKTTSTVSKYELGKIAVDIETLYEIAEVLNVAVEQLVDYRGEAAENRSSKASGFFTLSSRFYIYQSFLPVKRIVTSCMEIVPDESSEYDRAMLYYDINESEDPTNANWVYRGTVHYCGSYVTMAVANQFGGFKDDVFYYVKNPLWTRSTTTGLMLCCSQTLGNPVVAKVVFSTEKLHDEELLRDVLNINNREVTSAMKRTNYLMLYDSWENML